MMTIRDISFVGFLKLNLFLIFIPSILNNLIYRLHRSLNTQEHFRTLHNQGSPSLERLNSQRPDVIHSEFDAVSPNIDLLIGVGTSILTSLAMTYFLAKLLHILAQNTKIGTIKIGTIKIGENQP